MQNPAFIFSMDFEIGGWNQENRQRHSKQHTGKKPGGIVGFKSAKV